MKEPNEKRSHFFFGGGGIPYKGSLVGFPLRASMGFYTRVPLKGLYTGFHNRVPFKGYYGVLEQV